MQPTHLPFPDPAAGLTLHLALCDLAPDATADVCRAYLVPLLDCLQRRFPGVDLALLESAAHDALFKYVQAPTLYQPDRGDLAVFLRVMARSKFLNLWEEDQRHHRRRVAWSVVENAGEDRYLPGREEEPPVALEDAEEAQGWQDCLRSVEARSTPEERRVLHLMLAGERQTPVFAEALGLGGRPDEEQERAVKRAKDRLKTRLKRERERHA